MQMAVETAMSQSLHGAEFSDCLASNPTPSISGYRVICRSRPDLHAGSDKIRLAMFAAHAATKGGPDPAIGCQTGRIDERTVASPFLFVRLPERFGSASGRSGEEFSASGSSPEPG